MTDRPNSYVLGKGTLHFRHLGFRMDAATLKETMEAPYRATVQMAGDIYERFVNTVLFTMRVHWIVGYNPQKLLPAPSFEDEFMQSMSEWAAEQMKLPYYQFDMGFKLYPYQEAAMRAYEKHRDSVVGEPLVVGLDLVEGAMHTIRMDEAFQHATNIGRIINYVYATCLHESAGGSPTPRGKIEIYDYDDRTVIELEGEGELPGRRDLVDDLFSGHFARQLGKTASMTAMMHKLERRPAPQKSYLDHDPTKRHKRRKKK